MTPLRSSPPRQIRTHTQTLGGLLLAAATAGLRVQLVDQLRGIGFADVGQHVPAGLAARRRQVGPLRRRHRFVTRHPLPGAFAAYRPMLSCRPWLRHRISGDLHRAGGPPSAGRPKVGGLGAGPAGRWVGQAGGRGVRVGVVRCRVGGPAMRMVPAARQAGQVHSRRRCRGEFDRAAGWPQCGQPMCSTSGWGSRTGTRMKASLPAAAACPAAPRPVLSQQHG
jgi:hypothetical protein